MQVNDVQKMAIKAALEKMFRDGHFSICTVDKVLKITGGVPSREDYELLNLLHCVHYKDMDKELLRGLPVILARVIGSEAIGFGFCAGETLSLLRLDRWRGGNQ